MLGKLITEESHRDAIHIAIAPVVAAEKLAPGQEVGFVEGSEVFVEPSGSPIGIIDPFLKGLVFPDQSCWLCLFPETVTGMRHHWSHPAFAGTEPAAAESQPLKDDASLTSEAWLRDLAEEVELSFDALLDAARAYRDRGEYHRLGFDTPDRCYTESEEFWRHFTVVTGEPGDRDGDNIFSCAC